MSACELWQEFAAAKLRQHDDTVRDVVHAWQAVRIYVLTQNQRQLPPLSRLLREMATAATPAKPAQSMAEQKTTLQALSLLYGLPLRQRKTRRVIQPHEAKPVTVLPVTRKRVVRKVRHR